MTSTNLNTFFSNPEVLQGAKVAIVSAEVAFILFTLVVLRQVTSMNKAFNTSVAGFFKLLSLLLFFAAVGIMLLSLIIL